MKKITIGVLENISDILRWLESNYNNRQEQFLFDCCGDYMTMILDTSYDAMEQIYTLKLFGNNTEISASGVSLNAVLYSMKVRLESSFLVAYEEDFQWWEEDEEGNVFPIFKGDLQV